MTVDTITGKLALLGMPAYMSVSASSARSYWMASKGQVRVDSRQCELAVDRMHTESSLLALNCNMLWAWALNKAESTKVDYFAMLHSDVEPVDFWLDALIEELEARSLDVLSVVLPLKDQNGLTSTALDREDRNNFRPLCRLTMKELYDLPETFTSEDVSVYGGGRAGGAKLLINTGCMVCKWGDWAEQAHFTINDRIVYCAPRKMYAAEVEPEDWYFSRLLHELGLKVGATRKVRAEHRGQMCFTNSQPWGCQEFDIQYTSKPIVVTARQPGFRFPHDVDGWLLPEEGRALAELARDKRVLEIGGYCGKSTICLAQAADWVVTVDPHDRRGTPKPKSTREELLANLERYELGNVTAMTATLREACDSLEDEVFDIIFIDGQHDYESVVDDVECAQKLLSPDGLLVFHDYRLYAGQYDGRWDPGVTEAVDNLLAAGAELISTNATLAVVRLSSAREECHA